MSTHRTFPVESRRPPISHETFLFMRSEIERLTQEREADLRAARAERDYWRARAREPEAIERLSSELHAMTVDRDRWYLRATYTDEERAEMYHRASQGLDENGAWLWPDSVRTTK